ncbi:hypothetical protein D9M71_542570 [compost metagenome]|jgi:hypothetical protein
MKARIEKKLSKRLPEIAPSQFHGAWIDKDEPSELAYEQKPGSATFGALEVVSTTGVKAAMPTPFGKSGR